MTGTGKRLTRHRFYKAEQEAGFVEAQRLETPQTQALLVSHVCAIG